MFEKVKNGSGNRLSKKSFLLGLGLAALVGGIIGFFIKPSGSDTPGAGHMAVFSASLPIGEETVVVPLDISVPVRTVQQYSGIVTMFVTGTGQVSSSNYSDAFYTYMNAERQLLNPPTMQFDFTLEIDGESAYNLLHLNSADLPFSPMHSYLLRYDVGTTPRHIALRTADRGLNDNTGQLLITILGNVSWLQTAPAAFVATSVPEPITATQGGEMVVAPFNSGSPVYTEKLYSGKVTLLLRGTGQAGGADSSDAFYLYERGDHSPYVLPVLGDFAMELDGQKIHEVLNSAPSYNADHVYRVTYDVGPEPRRIGFRNTDLSTGDNKGAYSIEVIASGG